MAKGGKPKSERPVPLYYTYCDRCGEAKPARIPHHPVIVAGSSGQEQQLICGPCIDAAEQELGYRLRTFGTARRPSGRPPIFALIADTDRAKEEDDEDTDREAVEESGDE